LRLHGAAALHSHHRSNGWPKHYGSDPESRMSKLRLTLACWNYDRTRALQDGRVQPDGIDLNYLSLPVEETFFRMLRHREFEAAEMSLSSYTVSLFREPRPFVAIPVFPSRMFRHSSIYVNAAAGIREPRDLAGRRIGNPEYQMTAPVWIRGILSDEYGVPVDSPTYLTGGEEEPDRDEKLKLDLPPGFRLQPIGPGKTLARMLADGEIDALQTARMPSTYRSGDGRVRRLFEDYLDVERDYFRRTRIFPIMHTVVVRRDVYEQHPWVAQSLFKAFCAAQRDAYDDLSQTAALKVMLPWLTAGVEAARREMGEDFWPYGFAPNRATLDTFLRYHHEQGLSKRRLQPADLFAPQTLESFRI
jgi:4,5-dihydroxyphthalate decarboxylase